MQQKRLFDDMPKPCHAGMVFPQSSATTYEQCITWTRTEQRGGENKEIRVTDMDSGVLQYAKQSHARSPMSGSLVALVFERVHGVLSEAYNI